MTESSSGHVRRPVATPVLRGPLMSLLVLPIALLMGGCEFLFPAEGACVTSYGSCLEDFMEDSCSDPGDQWYEDQSCADVGHDDNGGGGGGCGDYYDSYPAGDHAIYYCQAAWNHQCYGDEQSRVATCAVLRDFAGDTNECPYCD
jgi:hypothetical protein